MRNSEPFSGGLLDHPVLSKEQEVALFIRYQAGDELALEEIVRCNQKLVHSIARRYQGQGIDLEDLHQIGNEGLLVAIKRFDYTMGNKFSTHATWWIRQSIPRAIGNNSKGIRLPVHVHSSLLKLHKVKETLRALGITEPTDSDLAQEMGVTTEKIRELERAARLEPLSYDRPLESADDATMLDVLADQSQPETVDLVAKAQTAQLVRELVESIENSRERKMLKLRFGLWDEETLPYKNFVDGEYATLEEAGAAFGITRERVRQVTAKTMTTLRKRAKRKAELFAA